MAQEYFKGVRRDKYSDLFTGEQWHKNKLYDRARTRADAIYDPVYRRHSEWEESFWCRLFASEPVVPNYFELVKAEYDKLLAEVG